MVSASLSIILQVLLGQVLKRIDEATHVLHLEMEVRAGGFACRSDLADSLAAAHILADLRIVGGQMAHTVSGSRYHGR